MAWWTWAVLAWAVLATVAVWSLSVALYQRAEQVRALTDDRLPPTSRPHFQHDLDRARGW